MSAHISRIGQAPLNISDAKDRLLSLIATWRAHRARQRDLAQVNELRETLSAEVLSDIGLTPRTPASTLSDLGQAYSVMYCTPSNDNR